MLNISAKFTVIKHVSILYDESLAKHILFFLYLSDTIKFKELSKFSFQTCL